MIYDIALTYQFLLENLFVFRIPYLQEVLVLSIFVEFFLEISRYF